MLERQPSNDLFPTATALCTYTMLLGTTYTNSKTNEQAKYTFSVLN